ncbi:Transketolase, pyridine binding domain containing protein, partial [Reticulomyxa filosa]
VFAIYDTIDAREVLKASIRDPDPCVVLENEMMYGSKVKVPESWFDESTITLAQIGKARLLKSGSDLTIVTHARMCAFALEAAAILEKEDGVSVEVINNRCLRPMDRSAIVNSVKKTHRLLYVEEGWPQCGIAAEVCATIMESEAFDYLDAPVERVCGIDVPMPYCPNLEEMVLPSTASIVAAARRTLKGRKSSLA